MEYSMITVSQSRDDFIPGYSGSAVLGELGERR